MTMQKTLQAGAVLRGDSLYINRDADDKILEYIAGGEQLICLAEPHQSGKTSLDYSIRNKLKESSEILTAYIDLQTIFGYDSTEMQCYFSIAKRISNEFGLSPDKIKELWKKYNEVDPKAFCRDFFQTLSDLNKKIVIFIDEIGLIPPNLNFNSFFSALADVKNISFVLSGVFTTRYIGKSSPAYLDLKKTYLPLKDFTRSEINKFSPFFPKAAGIIRKQILDEIYKWTNGQPYMTQKIVKASTDFLSCDSTVCIDDIVNDLFLKDFFYSEVNLASSARNFDIFIEEPERRKLALEIYEYLLRNEKLMKSQLRKQFPGDRRLIEDIIEDLRICGFITVNPRSGIKCKNEIIRRTFSEKWIHLQRKTEQEASKNLTENE